MEGERTDRVVTVTGKLVDQQLDDEQAESWSEGDIRHSRGLRERQVVEWSDPRLPAIKNTVFNYIQYPHPTRVAAVFEGSHLLEDEDGSWAGTSTGVSYPDGSIEGQDVLVGRGAYEGLYAVLHACAEIAPGDGGTTVWRGMIFTGSAPPAPKSP